MHAALFASVEAGGSAQLWDLNSNTEVIFAIFQPQKYTLPYFVIQVQIFSIPSIPLGACGHL